MKNEAQPYDITTKDRVIRGRLPLLEEINDRITIAIRKKFSVRLKEQFISSNISTDLLKYGELVNTLPIPSFITNAKAHILEPFNFHIILENKVAFGLLEKMLGYSGDAFEKIEGKPFTSIETKLLHQIEIDLLDSIQEGLQSLFKDTMVKYKSTETNPMFLRMLEKSDVVIATTLEIDCPDFSGVIMIILPFDNISRIFNKQAKLAIKKGIFNKVIPNLESDVNIVLSEKQEKISIVKKLQKGDVIEFPFNKSKAVVNDKFSVKANIKIGDKDEH